MSSYTSRLQRHLKNHAKQLRSAADARHSEALDIAAADFGFSGWKQATVHIDDLRLEGAMSITRYLNGQLAEFASEILAARSVAMSAMQAIKL